MTFEKRFAGRRAVVTGGAAGIGLAVTQRLAAEGAHVSMWDRDAKAIEAATEGDAITGITLDLTDAGAVERAASETAERIGGIDILVCSAGVTGPNTTTWEYPVDAWRQVFDVNVHGLFYANRACVPHMISGGHGRIVNIASIAGKEGNPNAPAYSASKAGMIGMARTWALELAKHGITVNVVAPGPILTDNFWGIIPKGSEREAELATRIPVGRLGTVEDVTNAFLFFCDPKSGFVTGQTLYVCGGASVGGSIL